MRFCLGEDDDVCVQEGGLPRFVEKDFAVYDRSGARRTHSPHSLPPPDDEEEVGRLLRTVALRVVSLLRKQGKLENEDLHHCSSP